jgi:hypothetical protein
MEMIVKTARIDPRRVALAALPLPASAHHSYAMFDMQKTVALEATVIRFKWQNPHAFIEADALRGRAPSAGRSR